MATETAPGTRATESNPPATPAYPRILLKLSGEALMGNDSFGINREMVDRIVGEVKEVSDLGVQVGVVIGGGNIFRGVSQGAAGMDRATADYMGMLATVINALALQDAMDRAGLVARVQSASTSSRSASPTSAARRSATSRRARSSSSPRAPATRSSPRIRRRRCARSRWKPTSC